MSGGMVPIGSKVPVATHEQLRWLAYKQRTTVSAIVAGYVARCLPGEDFTGYEEPPSRDAP